jgi:hypothetical protein
MNALAKMVGRALLLCSVSERWLQAHWLALYSFTQVPRPFARSSQASRALGRPQSSERQHFSHLELEGSFMFGFSVVKRLNWLLGTDMQQQEAALRLVLHAGQRQR